MSTRREPLTRIDKVATTNAGLWLDKFIADLKDDQPDQKSKDKGKHELVEQVAGIAVPEIYRKAFERWSQIIHKLNAETRVAKTVGRLVIGLGNESVLETGITLQRTYGVPYIPGSALKGLAANFARQHLDETWQKGRDNYWVAFGDTNSAGYVTFYDAWFIPDPKNNHPLRVDVMTPHHSDYNQPGPLGPIKPPADWDDPTPIPFSSAIGDYLLALSGPSDWVKVTLRILHQALRHEGIGAKTSSGYGRLEVDLESVPLAESYSDGAKNQKTRDLLRRINAIPPNRLAGELAQCVKEWKALNVEDIEKRVLARAIVDRVNRLEKKEIKNFGKKDWYQDVLKAAG